MKRFLATTALEETWSDGEPMVFLGEWCRLYSRKARWSSLDTVVLPYHWEDQETFRADYEYLRGFYERVLGLLATRLNAIHHVDFDLRYWRILVGPWLGYFLHIVFDRWSSVQQAVTDWEISGTTILTGNDDSLVPNDMEELARMMIGDAWNHHIYGLMLRHFTAVPITDVARPVSHAATPTISTTGLKHRLAARYARIASYFVRDRDALLIRTYLPSLSALQLQLRLRQVPQIWDAPSAIRVPIDLRQREWALDIPSATAFETVALALIPKQIPALYLEGYRRLSEHVERLPWPRRPRLIFTSNVLWHDTVSAAYTANKVSEGVRLVYGQHGGGYGVAAFTWAEEHEVAISDKYLTWGWDDASKPTIEPLGILKRGDKREGTAGARNRLVFVSLNLPRFTHRLSSDLFMLSDRYYASSFLFTETLPKTIRRHLLVRATSFEFGWHEVQRWNDRFPDVEVDPGVLRMTALLLDARLAVYSYNSTGLLEAFASDVPCVCFWDPAMNPLRHSAIPYYEDLKRVGIFHETPESAGLHVATVWDDVDAWWSSPAVQKVLERFRYRYCRAPDDVLDRLEVVLRDVMADATGD